MKWNKQTSIVFHQYFNGKDNLTDTEKDRIFNDTLYPVLRMIACSILKKNKYGWSLKPENYTDLVSMAISDAFLYFSNNSTLDDTFVTVHTQIQRSISRQMNAMRTNKLQSFDKEIDGEYIEEGLLDMDSKFVDMLESNRHTVAVYSEFLEEFKNMYEYFVFRDPLSNKMYITVLERFKQALIDDSIFIANDDKNLYLRIGEGIKCPGNIIRKIYQQYKDVPADKLEYYRGKPKQYASELTKQTVQEVKEWVAKQNKEKDYELWLAKRHTCHKSKLTVEEIKEIKSNADARQGERGLIARLAKQFKVSASTMWYVLNNQTHLEQI